MKIPDVIAGIALRCTGMTDERMLALASDLRLAGAKDGLALAEIFDRWRANWTKRVSPTAAEFMAFAPIAERTMATTRPAKKPWADHVMTLPEGEEAIKGGFARELWLWAEKNPGMIPGADVMDECYRREMEFRASLSDAIETAKAGNGGFSPAQRLLWSAALRAGANMNAFEVKLGKLRGGFER